MKIHEVPEDIKVYEMKVVGGSTYVVTGKQKENIISAQSQFITLPSGESVNKSYIIEFKLNYQETRDKVQENKSSLMNL